MYSMLIADDEKVIRESLADCVDWAARGIRVVGCCANGLEALETIIDEAPDIVMTDIKMPGLGGLELIEKIQGIDQEMEFIIISGFREFEFAKKAMEFGVRRYLLKPIHEEQLLDAVEDAKRCCLEKRSIQETAKEHRELQQQIDRYRQKMVLSNEGSLEKLQQFMDQLTPLFEQGAEAQIVSLIHMFFGSIDELFILRAYAANYMSRLFLQVPSQGAVNLSGAFDHIYRETDAAGILDILVSRTLRLLPDQDDHTSLIQRVMDYVAGHLADSNLSLKQIATQYVHTNVDYLSRIFAQKTGEKFSHYLNRLRVETAKQLLRQNGCKVCFVAEQVGCGHNPRYFSQIFKKYAGMTPTAFVEQVAGQPESEIR